MVKLTFNLPICGGCGQSDEAEDQCLKPNLCEDQVPDHYDKFPYSTFFPEEGEAHSDPLLNKSSPEYRQRVQETLNALQDEYQKAYEKYKECNRRILAEKEKLDQLLWNLAVLDISNVCKDFDSMDSVHDEVKELQHKERDEAWERAADDTLHQQRRDAKMLLYRIEIALETGLRELTRLDNGVESDAFRQLRNAWARRRSGWVDDEREVSSAWWDPSMVDGWRSSQRWLCPGYARRGSEMLDEEVLQAEEGFPYIAEDGVFVEDSRG
ncbi:hypothetical protein ACHAPT_000909 [Fusarium lateritium]